jgi:hypothetical protein
MCAWRRWIVPVLGVLALIALAGSAAAGQPSTVPPGVKAAVLEQYRVLIVRDGVVLTPRRGPAYAIEISKGGIAIDGAPVTGRELHDRLGARADLVAQLSFVTPEALRAAFAEGGTAAPAPPAPPLAPEAPAPEAPPALSEPPEVPEPPAAPEPPEPPRRRSSAKVQIGGDVDVAEDEVVTDPVVAILGSVTVLGRVEDDVVSVLGNVHLGPKAEVMGSVTAVGGRVEQERGADVRGEVQEIGIAGPMRFGPAHAWGMGHEIFSSWFRLFGTILRVALVLLLALVIAIAAAKPVERIARRAGDEPWTSGFVGLAAQVFFVPVLVVTVVVLAISIIGIPLLILVPFALVALLFGILMGFTGVAQRVGTWAIGTGRGPLIPTAVGVVLIAAGAFLARLLWLLPGPIAPIAIVVSILGLFLEYVAWTVGLGAMLLTRFGTRGPADAEPIYVPPIPSRVPDTPPATDTPPPASSDLPLQE